VVRAGLVAGIIAAGLPAAALRAQEVATMAIEDLAWLAGCWQAEGGEPGSVEHWLAPAGGTLLGMSRAVKNGCTVAHEFMQIRRDDAGRVVFIAAPSGQATTTFVRVGGGAAEVVFENPAHDFPQRVIYRRTGPDRLLGRIEGLRNGAPRAIDFPFVRLACDTGRP
jgi:hypothetical protein